jgi:hypothetical protein
MESAAIAPETLLQALISNLAADYLPTSLLRRGFIFRRDLIESNCDLLLWRKEPTISDLGLALFVNTSRETLCSDLFSMLAALAVMVAYPPNSRAFGAFE